jgi:MFS family permease
MRMPGNVLRGRYGATVVVMLLALCPDLIVASGSQPVDQIISRDLHGTQFALSLSSSMSDAGYALGAVIAVDLVQRFSQRPMFVATQVAAAIGAAVAAAANGPLLFGVGRTAQGLATGLLLVLALPPLVTTFGAGRIPRTMALVNIGLFGAAAAGPLVAAGVASTGAWRLELAAVAAASLLGAVLTVLTVPARDPFNPDQEFNTTLFPLAAAATVLPFFGASQLADHPAGDPIVWVPLAAGGVALLVLVVYQYRRRAPLIPVEKLSSTLPVAGTVCAMVGGAAFVLCLTTVQEWQSAVARRPPIDGATLFWPAVLGALVAAAIFAWSLRTRLLVAVVAAGLGCLLGASVLLLALRAGGGQTALVWGITVLLGLGAGMTVAPGLFATALSLPSTQVGRAVGVVELLRAEAAFVLGPVVVRLATVHGRQPGQVLTGLRTASVASIATAGGGLLVLGALLLAGRVGPQLPDIDTWVKGDEEAGLESPRVGEAVRSAR